MKFTNPRKKLAAIAYDFDHFNATLLNVYVQYDYNIETKIRQI